MQVNPVIEKELKTKMRGWKAPGMLTLYLGFLGIVIFLYFLTSNLLSPYNAGYFNPRVALNAYNTLTVFQLGLLMLIVPAMTAGAISGERERQTLDLLLCTNLSPFSIVNGKMLVSIAHIMLLITASLPIMGTVFLFGGIRFTDLLLLFGFYLTTAFMVASIGIFFSTVFKKSSVSIIMTYIAIGFLSIGTMIIFGIYTMFMYRNSPGKSPGANEILYFLFSNPLFGFSSAMEGMDTGMFFMDIFYRIGPGVRRAAAAGAFKPWMANMIFDAVAAVLFILASAWRIKPVKRAWRKK